MNSIWTNKKLMFVTMFIVVCLYENNTLKAPENCPFNSFKTLSEICLCYEELLMMENNTRLILFVSFYLLNFYVQHEE